MSEQERGTRALVQGAMLGTAISIQQAGGPLLIADVRQGTDDDGRYLPYFDLLMDSGTTIRITTTVVPSVTDQFLIEERVLDIRNRLRADMTRTIGVWTSTEDEQVRGVIDDLVDDAMHQIEPLLLEGK